jgi:hypothetical protein
MTPLAFDNSVFTLAGLFTESIGYIRQGSKRWS